MSGQVKDSAGMTRSLVIGAVGSFSELDIEEVHANDDTTLDTVIAESFRLLVHYLAAARWNGHGASECATAQSLLESQARRCCFI